MNQYALNSIDKINTMVIGLVTSVCVCVSVCPFCALTFDNLNQETPFWYVSTSSEYLGQVRVSRSSGQGQSHRRKRDKNVTKYTFAGGPPSIQRQII